MRDEALGYLLTDPPRREKWDDTASDKHDGMGNEIKSFEDATKAPSCWSNMLYCFIRGCLPAQITNRNRVQITLVPIPRLTCSRVEQAASLPACKFCSLSRTRSHLFRCPPALPPRLVSQAGYKIKNRSMKRTPCVRENTSDRNRNIADQEVCPDSQEGNFPE
jgi:hypothetical protein